MKYTLMHKNICVADIDIDEDTAVILSVDNITAKEHLPLGVVHSLRHQETMDKAMPHKVGVCTLQTAAVQRGHSIGHS